MDYSVCLFCFRCHYNVPDTNLCLGDHSALPPGDAAPAPQQHYPGDLNTKIWLVETDHVTLILTSDWFRWSGWGSAGPGPSARGSPWPRCSAARSITDTSQTWTTGRTSGSGEDIRDTPSGAQEMLVIFVRLVQDSIALNRNLSGSYLQALICKLSLGFQNFEQNSLERRRIKNFVILFIGIHAMLNELHA